MRGIGLFELWPITSVWILTPICLLEVLYEGGRKEFCRLLMQGNSQKRGCGGFTLLTNIVGKAGIFGETQVLVLCHVSIERTVVQALEM